LFRWTDAVFIVILPSRLDGHEDGRPMEDAERFRLIGTYRTPRFRYGQRVLCEVRGEVTICGMTDAPIPWPVGKARRGRTSLVVYKGLLRAILRESNQAVAHWWGIDPQTVSKWRRLLGVERANEGTHRLHRDYTQEPWAVQAWAKAHAKARDPDRRAKIAAARRGKPRPPHVGRVVADARLWPVRSMPTPAERRFSDLEATQRAAPSCPPP
jgi:hypothetical protein